MSKSKSDKSTAALNVSTCPPVCHIAQAVKTAEGKSLCLVSPLHLKLLCPFWGQAVFFIDLMKWNNKSVFTFWTGWRSYAASNARFFFRDSLSPILVPKKMTYKMHLSGPRMSVCSTVAWHSNTSPGNVRSYRRGNQGPILVWRFCGRYISMGAHFLSNNQLHKLHQHINTVLQPSTILEARCLKKLLYCWLISKTTTSQKERCLSIKSSKLLTMLPNCWQHFVRRAGLCSTSDMKLLIPPLASSCQAPLELKYMKRFANNHIFEMKHSQDWSLLFFFPSFRSNQSKVKLWLRRQSPTATRAPTLALS